MKRFSTYDLIMIALMATLGLGTKQLVRPLVQIFTIPLVIPGGAVAGGFYMLWLVLTKRIVPKFGSGLIFGFVQALVVMILPFGSHGIFTFLTYPIPGLIADVICVIFTKSSNKIFSSMLEGIFTNLTGTIIVSILILDIPNTVLIFVIALAIFSGNIGGMLAYGIYKQIKLFHIQEIIIDERKIEEVNEKG